MIQSIRPDLVDRGRIMRVVREVVATLSRCERHVSSLRFGLLGGPPVTLREVEARLGLLRERVRMIEVEVVEKLERRRSYVAREGGKRYSPST